jgi:hypothetical protein
MSKNCLVLYDPNAGEADVVALDTNGGVSLDAFNSGWSKSWDLFVVGDFIGDGRQQVLAYDRNAGQAAVIAFDSKGGVSLDATNSGWRKSWDPIVAGDFLGDGRQQVVAYDSKFGQADVIAFDSKGGVSLDNTNSGWRKSWDLIVAGIFLGPSTTQLQGPGFSSSPYLIAAAILDSGNYVLLIRGYNFGEGEEVDITVVWTVGTDQPVPYTLATVTADVVGAFTTTFTGVVPEGFCPISVPFGDPQPPQEFQVNARGLTSNDTASTTAGPFTCP